MSPTRVVIVDDHPLVRRSLRILLNQSPNIEVIAETDNGEEAINLTSQLQPDLILMDVSMPGMDGITATRHILAMKLPVLILVLSMYADAALAREALRLGARGYLLKSHASDELVQAIHQMKQGEIVLSPEVKVSLRRG